jgi:ketosteroid isomerase-like protein
MRSLVAQLAVVLVCVSTLSAQSAAEKPEQDIRQVLEQQVQAWNRKDLDSFMVGYWNSPDLTFFSGGNVSKGWQSALDHYRRTYQGEGREMGKLEFSGLQIEVLTSDSAFVRGSWHLTMPDGKAPHGLFTLIFRKFPDGWKIVHDHTSVGD